MTGEIIEISIRNMSLDLWFGVVGQQAIIWTNVTKALCRHVISQG